MLSDHPMQIHVHLLSAMLDFGVNVQQAIAAPHWSNRRLAVGGVPGQQGELSGRADVDEYREKTVVEAVFLANCFPRDLLPSHDPPGHRTFIYGPWEDGMRHEQAIVINPETHIF